jgi:hypothetical protein
MIIVKKYLEQAQNGKFPLFQQEVDIKTITAPVGGWDAISPLSNMDSRYAVVLDNWVPRPGYIEIRGGYNNWAQGLSSSPVETLMTYRPQTSGEQALFAATGNSIWDVTQYGMPVEVLTGLLNARWQYINFTPAGAPTRLCMVNGQDSYTTWDGTSWTNPTITGVDTTTLINIFNFKRRIWFIQENSMSAWFLDTDAIQGPATEFPLGSFCNKGGYLVAMGSWTLDGGNGPDDYAAFITSRGQIVIYRGTDPTSDALFIQVGVFNIPPPISRRCLARVGSDLYIITIEGLLPISQSLPFDPAASRSQALTMRIQNAMLQAAQNGLNLFGWQCLTFPQQSLLVMNVPVIENNTQYQYVMNTIGGPWTRFTGWNANCFEIFNESLYFGDNDGNVALAYTGPLDLISPINFDMQCAFNYFEQPSRVKNMTMVRPFLFADSTFTPTISINVDFGTDAQAAPVTVLETLGGIWDESVWGPASEDVAIWSSSAVAFAFWQSAQALGTALSVRMQVNLAGAGSSINANTIIQSVFDTGVFDTMVFDGNGSVTASGEDIPMLQVNAFQAMVAYGSPV